MATLDLPDIYARALGPVALGLGHIYHVALGLGHIYISGKSLVAMV